MPNFLTHWYVSNAGPYDGPACGGPLPFEEASRDPEQVDCPRCRDIIVRHDGDATKAYAEQAAKGEPVPVHIMNLKVPTPTPTKED